MQRTRAHSGAPWEARVGYCRAVRAGDFISVSGTTAVDESGAVVGTGDMRQQADKCLKIIANALKELGATTADIIRTRIYVTDISRWEEVADAHQQVFGQSPPAATMVEVSALVIPDLLVEIEADAIVSRSEASEES